MGPVRVTSAGLLSSYPLHTLNEPSGSWQDSSSPLDIAGQEGLLELAWTVGAATSQVAAIERLGQEKRLQVSWRDFLEPCLQDPSPAVRLAALNVAGAIPAESWLAKALFLRLRRDSSWPIRAKAVELLSNLTGASAELASAGDDPHWRVRSALIDVYRNEANFSAQEQILGWLTKLAEKCRFPNRPLGVRAYLQFLWRRELPQLEILALDPLKACPFWDWDDAVLARRLEQMPQAERKANIGSMPFLLAQDEPRVHGPAIETLRRQGEVPEILAALQYLGDPRHGAHDRVRELLQRIDLDRIEATALYILRGEGLTMNREVELAWALSQIGEAIPWESASPLVSPYFIAPNQFSSPVWSQMVSLAVQFQVPRRQAWLDKAFGSTSTNVQTMLLKALLQSQSSLSTADRVKIKKLLASSDREIQATAVRLVAPTLSEQEAEVLASQLHAPARIALAESLAKSAAPGYAGVLRQFGEDVHPYIRAAALTPASAAKLLENPDAETSWFVLRRAARVARVPFWKIVPVASRFPATAATRRPTLELLPRPPASIAHPRLLGPAGIPVSPLALSGHYGLPVEGFARGVSAGINLFFWEPNYSTLTGFSRGISRTVRDEIHFIAGSFEAEPKRIERDVERALRNLNLERLSLFMLFWVRSKERVPESVRDLLVRLCERSRIRMFGLSTHDRDLAMLAMKEGWNPLMVRHSAAHWKAESEIFRGATLAKTSVITFSNTCYGRLARAVAKDGLSVADCYRYSLAQPGVTTCLSAPATLEQLSENLQLLGDLALPEASRQILQSRGKDLYAQESAFRKLVHSQ